ncbi:hypothetical protein A3C91_03725 [Candidatus Azambacteria bacterium RIFCSPHIGHO2_02_FULL_52_12]|uniref:PrgI family protein n=1 Tax=Candidatus Azambacteria bacterium RIFCSPLOWO2_01_FULL_46_25 TaxID=1797298 RepID=A0A1F5BUW2_9BACT|nr:MAG: hypothetical protein A3C91_03725 [Candidatus Azambacteria bacterium RIFCSPHIGHO2_02_FULL_52_12]OGD34361.1 MAG: hypothetical protein A2988_02425 [Candidatus Azambacteria bacterium RIFCSPLOWO2_01_FULL_46_25]OGD37361.1 MAG: hypothetical protein A2850_01460 [Candidatus Azambacteria bacterium RIFCSPHIGHO2_01_FULL_51_74]
MKQFQVPQFIDVEDKILGPITMRQFFIMLIPFGTGILLSFILSLWLAIIVTIPVAIGAAVFAFYRPYGMRFSRFFAAFLAYQLKPRMYIWKREGAPRVVFENSPGGGERPDVHEKRVPKGGLKNIKGTIETGSAYKE